VVLGHVDAGKSTLMGRLLADLGVVTQKQVCCPADALHA
jgi:translation elongation factor EF-1alpha